MPRSAATARRGHHHSSNRHENGVVIPGKRVTQQKSNGYLNGSLSSGGSSSSSSQVDLCSSSDPSAAATVAATRVNGAADGSKMEGPEQSYVNGDAKGNVEMAYGHSNGTAAPNGTIAGHISSRSTEKVAWVPKKTAQSSPINPLLLASTILKSCPMFDTIAILIFLLQLPPMVLTLVQFLFASLTFMPPGGASAGSLTSNFDIFQGPAGTPSLGTMIAMDGFCLLVWGLFMWTWAQNFALDLAHVQVAITLGGGGAGKNGGVNALCVGIVLLLHLVQSKGIQDFVVGHLLSAKLVGPDLMSRWSHLIPSEFRRTATQSSPSWIRSLLAIHILAQAGTAMARRSMAKNRSPAPSRFGKRVDTEASAGSQTQIDSAFESGASAASALAADGQVVTSSAWKESKDRLTSAKKRRRQANQVRSRQPFWAALASTKVTVMREYEHSRAVSKTTRGIPMTEDDLQGITLDDGLIWITSVDSSSIKFAAGDLASPDDPTSPTGCEDGPLECEDMEPFYVCVNGAHWATATVCKVPDQQKGLSAVTWHGEISGLAPNCAYSCSFVRSDTDEEICSMSVKTPPTPDAEQAATSSVSTRPFHRPSSPTTTLKNSITNAEVKLNEKRTRLKKAKTDHKLVVSKVRKELDNYNNRLNSGNDENRQKQRSLQLERNIRQTEEATAVLETQLDNMENAPEGEQEKWSFQKAAFDGQVELLNSAKEEVTAARMAGVQEISTLETELSSSAQKHERLQGRKARVNEQYERMISANAQGLNERERRAAEQFAREQEQARLQATFIEQFAIITRSVQNYQMRTNQLWKQATAIEEAIQRQQQQMLMETGPLTPEGSLPGTTAQPENLTTAAGMTTITPANSRSVLGMSPLNLKSSPHQNVAAATSYQTSPLQAPLQQHSFQASSRVSASTYFAPDFNYRERSSSNRSARSSLHADFELVDAGRVSSFLADPFDSVSVSRRQSNGSDSRAQAGSAYGPIGNLFGRTGSRGSGSSNDSPSSARSKAIPS